jgi:hypothetical protein
VSFGRVPPIKTAALCWKNIEAAEVTLANSVDETDVVL